MLNERSLLPGPIERNSELENLICNIGIRKVISENSIFLKPGMHIGGIIYIKDGQTRHYFVGKDGTEKVLYVLTAGWFFGESPCDVNEPTSLYSCADKKTEIYFIPHKAYNELMDNNKSFRNAILNSYSSKLLILRNSIEELSCDNCKKRLVRFLFSDVDKNHRTKDGWYPLCNHFTQAQISTIIGGSRVTVSRLLHELQEEGKIRTLNRNIQIEAHTYETYMNRIKG